MDYFAFTVLMRSYCTSKPPDVSEIRNINPLGNIQSKVYYFDTLAVVQKLMTEGAYVDCCNSVILITSIAMLFAFFELT